MSRARRPGRLAVSPHPFVQQDGEPADPWTGLAPCATCRKVGRSGDAQHPDPELPAVPDEVADLEARRLGERD
ncbi:hypothetical protein GCM10012279_35270 [Micromonospora yangpuensis]|nr:hypothetical protein GCM10012279_35270 [Micromonospora yangpuensis]